MHSRIKTTQSIYCLFHSPFKKKHVPSKIAISILCNLLIIAILLLTACNNDSKPIQKNVPKDSMNQKENLLRKITVSDGLHPDPTDIPGMYRGKSIYNSAVEGKIRISYFCDPSNIKKDRFITDITIDEPHRSFVISFNKCRRNNYLLDSLGINWAKLDLSNAEDISYYYTEDYYGIYNIDSPNDTGIHTKKPNEIKKIWNEHYAYFKVLK